MATGGSYADSSPQKVAAGLTGSSGDREVGIQYNLMLSELVVLIFGAPGKSQG